MQIWVDADSVPLVAKDLIVKTAERTQTMAIFVANQPLKLRKSPLLVMTVVPSGFDKADDYIVEKMKFKSKQDKSVIIYNNHITIKNIPEKAYEYVVNGRPAIDWIINQYQVKTDEKSGITDDPNEFSNNPKYILNLLLSVITVSMRTLELIDELPPFEVTE